MRRAIVTATAACLLFACSDDVEPSPDEEDAASPQIPAKRGAAGDALAARSCSTYSIRTRRALVNGFGIGALADGRVLLDDAIYDARTDSVAPVHLRTEAHPAVLLGDGTFLFAGYGACGNVECGVHATTARFDPTSDTMISTAPMLHGRGATTAVSLLDGRVLALGDATGSWNKFRDVPAPAPPEIYDPAQDAWTASKGVPVARLGASATRLHDGRVLVVGGSEAPRDGCQWCVPPNPPPTAIAELYDPATDGFIRTAPMLAPRTEAISVTTDDGSVFVFGGSDERRGERFDPATESWSWTSPSPFPLPYTALLLNAVALLPCGGIALLPRENGGGAGPWSLLIYDPASDSWRVVPYPAPVATSIIATPVGAMLVPLYDSLGKPSPVRILGP